MKLRKVWLETDEEERGHTKAGKLVGWSRLKPQERQRNAVVSSSPLVLSERWTLGNDFGGEESA